MRGYSPPGSNIWHKKQRCTNGYFSRFDKLTAEEARQIGLRPCGICCQYEWPDQAERDADDGSAESQPNTEG